MNKKHGFTISELLMSIAIISIVSAMGMTIAKRGTEDAYKNYFAAGTMNLNNALAQIETGNVNVAYQNNVLVQQNGAGNPNIIFDDFEILTEHLRYLFGDNRVFGENAIENINTKNGITYLIGNIVSNNNIPVSVNIQMTVPAPRTRQNTTGRLTTEFLYVRNIHSRFENIDNLGNDNILIPTNSQNLNANPPLVSIQNRHDLLTAYIDDGVVGRHVLEVFNYSGSKTNINKQISHDTFIPITYGTYRDAYCTVLNKRNPEGFPINIDCDETVDISIPGRNVFGIRGRRDDGGNLQQDDDGDNVQEIFIPNADARTGDGSAGVIKFASPRKLK